MFGVVVCSFLDSEGRLALGRLGLFWTAASDGHLFQRLPVPRDAFLAEVRAQIGQGTLALAIADDCEGWPCPAELCGEVFCVDAVVAKEDVFEFRWRFDSDRVDLDGRW